MESRWSVAAIVLFWILTMSWLFGTKVLPVLVQGNQPDFQDLLAEQPEDAPPVAWQVFWNDQPVGKAASKIVRGEQVTKVHNYLSFTLRGQKETFPLLLQPLVKSLMQEEIKVQTTWDFALNFDRQYKVRQYKVVGLKSRIKFGQDEVLKLRGAPDPDDGAKLKLSIRVPATNREKPLEISVPTKKLVGDDLSPHARMPVELNQKWTVPVYNPLQHYFGEKKMYTEILHAKVKGEEYLIQWGDKVVNTRLVVFRSSENSGNQERSKIWVLYDGTDDGKVIRQETTISLFNLKLIFERVPDEKSPSILDQLEKQW